PTPHGQRRSSKRADHTPRIARAETLVRTCRPHTPRRTGRDARQNVQTAHLALHGQENRLPA
ncbi:MAG: hypothetical protein II195_02450, partial [Selenomonadales bacterium]|nr:hypothetical protein [Selenomonadales bacterium]